jgi:large subunit ribosomal protein L17
MRHNNTNNKLGRKSAHRKSMLSNMAVSLILHKRIKTTKAKAKALRVFIEPILTKSKEDSTNARRLAFKYLQNKNAVTELFREISPKISERPGGYTRILKLGTRVGDAAEICYIELVDFNEEMLAATSAAEAKTTRRSRRGSKKKAEGTAEKLQKVKATDKNKPEDKKPEVKKEKANKSKAVKPPADESQKAENKE